ncbi:hypothetical protein TNCV_1627701 [Trichonephila clavipes]|nr:hypothetical protein TNCV_1627701 [Trichonephila clavipes]
MTAKFGRSAKSRFLGKRLRWNGTVTRPTRGFTPPSSSYTTPTDRFNVHQPLYTGGVACCCYKCDLIGNGQIETHEIHHGKGLHICLSLAVALAPYRVVRAFHVSSPSTNLTRGLETQRLFRVPPRREGTIHLQTSIPSSGFEPRPYGTAVSVINHETGWAVGGSEGSLVALGLDDTPATC